MLDKALGFTPDAFVPDLEDSVPDVEKENARRITAAHLAKLGSPGIAVIPRVNALGSPRIVAVAFGAEDFTDDMGIGRTEDESEVAFARNSVCIAARAAGVDALDTPFFRFQDSRGLQANVQAAKQLGFKGKFAIHPAQVDVINTLFLPTEAEIEHAQRVVAAFEEAERAGRGSTSLDGKVIDVPVVKRARSMLALADALSRPKPP